MGLLTKIIFYDGNELELNDDSIVVMVGPNNAGKTQSLNDIYDLCLHKRNTTRVVKDIQFHLPSQRELEAEVSACSKVTNGGRFIRYEGLNYSFTDSQMLALYRNRNASDSLGDLRNYFVSRLGTEGRLGMVFPPEVAGVDEIKNHPIQYLADSVESQRIVSSVFQQAFGSPLSVDILNGHSMPLRIGALPEIESFHTNDAMELFAQARATFSSFEEVHEQGDGMRSFAGIILNFLMKHWRTFIIDEPESFLHPPQANVLGRIIGSLLGCDRQCILATHSRDVIRGLLEVCPERVKVVRVTRLGNANSISTLDSVAIRELWSDPILKYSNIMDAMFHESVVLCESDSDCMMYSLVNSYISETYNRAPQSQFIHCGGKHRMARVINALQSLQIPFRVIPDLDLLNDRGTCKGLFEACGGCWEEVETDYTTACSSITQKEQRVSWDELNELLAGCSKPYLSKDEIRGITALLDDGKPWRSVKKNGFGAFPGGAATQAVRRLDEAFQQVGIFLVPVGELEMFNKSSGKHGPAWVSDVLEANPDIGDAVYDQIRSFVVSWHLWDE